MSVEKDISEIDTKIQTVNITNVSIEEAYKKVYQDIVAWPSCSDQKKRDIIRRYIEKIEIFPYPENNKRIVKSVQFKFPIEFYGEKGDYICWDKESNVEAVTLLSRTK